MLVLRHASKRPSAPGDPTTGTSSTAAAARSAGYSRARAAFPRIGHGNGQLPAWPSIRCFRTQASRRRSMRQRSRWPRPGAHGASGPFGNPFCSSYSRRGFDQSRSRQRASRERHVARMSRPTANSGHQPLITLTKYHEPFPSARPLQATGTNARNPHEMGTSCISARRWRREMLRSRSSHHRAASPIANFGFQGALERQIC